MNPDLRQAPRCGIDTVDILRVQKLVASMEAEALERLFTPTELKDAGAGPQRIASLAARFAAKEACCKLFTRETALGIVEPSDFSVRRDAYGAPQIELSADARAVLDRNLLDEVSVSLTHTETSASAVAWATPRQIRVPWYGRAIYHLLPFRKRVVLENLRLVFGESLSEEGIRRLAQAYCAHFAKFLIEFARFPLMSAAKKRDWVRVENMHVPIREYEKGKGLLLLTGHFGNWEVATVAGLSRFPQ